MASNWEKLCKIQWGCMVRHPLVGHIFGGLQWGEDIEDPGRTTKGRVIFGRIHQEVLVEGPGIQEVRSGFSSAGLNCHARH